MGERTETARFNPRQLLLAELGDAEDERARARTARTLSLALSVLFAVLAVVSEGFPWDWLVLPLVAAIMVRHTWRWHASASRAVTEVSQRLEALESGEGEPPATLPPSTS